MSPTEIRRTDIFLTSYKLSSHNSFILYNDAIIVEYLGYGYSQNYIHVFSEKWRENKYKHIGMNKKLFFAGQLVKNVKI